MARWRALLVLGLAVGAAGAAAAQPSTTLVASTASHVWLDGTTNVNRWRCAGDSLRVEAVVTAAPEELARLLSRWESLPSGSRLETPADPAAALGATLDLRIPITALDCANRLMERDMRKALRAESHPEIRYRFRRLREARFTPAGAVPAFTLVVDGDLELAGRSAPVAMTVSATRKGERIRLRAGMQVRMTDFGVEPPVALLGLIRARDALWVSLDLELAAPRAAVP